MDFRVGVDRSGNGYRYSGPFKDRASAANYDAGSSSQSSVPRRKNMDNRVQNQAWTRSREVTPSLTLLLTLRAMESSADNFRSPHGWIEVHDFRYPEGYISP